MLNFSKSITKKAFRRIGIEVHRYNPTSSPTAQLVASLKQFGIDLIVDVGANSGQFADGIRSGGYAGKIVSIEPLTVAHAKLTKVSRNDANWDVYQRCSVGDREGEVTINIAGNSVSSSLLPMLESHLNAAPHADYIGKEIVPLLTIDSIVPDYFKNFKKPFLKIDTQGFEWQVLNGAANSLPYIQGALLEMSLTPLYEGQHLWEDILVRMKESGFTLWALQPGFTDQVNGRTYQVDGIFFRTK